MHTPRTQEAIHLFADATLDHQWIHVDPQRAAEGPFGTTIAHGFLSLSLLAAYPPPAVIAVPPGGVQQQRSIAVPQRAQ